MVAARLTLKWPGRVILFPKTFIPLGSTLTASVTVAGFETDITNFAVQAKCLPSYQLASSLLHQHQQAVWSLQYFSGLTVHLHRHQSMWSDSKVMRLVPKKSFILFIHQLKCGHLRSTSLVPAHTFSSGAAILCSIPGTHFV